MIDELDLALNDQLNQLAMLETHAIRKVLGKHGLRRARYYLLKNLYDYPGLTLGQLSEKTFVYGASASRTIYSLEKEGVVQRETNEQDRRIITLSLTEKGQAFFIAVNNDLNADIQARYQTLDKPTKERIVADLTRLQDTLSAYLH